MEKEEEIQAVSVEGETGYYCLTEDMDELSSDTAAPGEVRFLSPFDNLIIHRDRIRRLLGFDYVLECYMPGNRRKYGYFVLPVLYHGDFPARMDVRGKKGILSVRNLVFREDFSEFDEFLEPFMREMAAFAGFNRCRRVVLEKVQPGKYLNKLRAEFGRIEVEPEDE